jgi:hypothetical protein
MPQRATDLSSTPNPRPADAGLESASSRVRGVLDRRTGIDRRLLAKMAEKFSDESTLDEPTNRDRQGAAPSDVPAAPNAHTPTDPDTYIDETGLERRRGPGRRRTDFTKSAEEGEMTQEQFLFIAAIEAFKRSNSKMFPTWTDVLEVVRLLGYRKTMPSELNLRNVEDWREKPDTASGVRSKPGHPEPTRRAA